MKRFAWLVPLLLLFAAACSNKGSDQNTTTVRVLNAVVDSEPLDLLIDDSAKISAVALGTTSAFANFDSGSHDTKLRSSTNSAVLFAKTLQYGSGTNYTLVAYGKRASMATVLLVDDTSAPSSGKFKIRMVGLSPEAGAVDVYLAAGDISAVPATLANIGYSTSSDFIELNPGTYRLTFTTAGTKDIVFQSTTQTFAAGSVYTAGVFPSVGGKLVNGVIITSGGGGALLSNPSGRLKAVNAVPDSTTLNFKADSSVLLSAVPFMGASTYVSVTAGARTLQVEASNVPGTNLASLSQTIASANDYTVVAVGNVAAPRLAAFTDDNTAPAAGFAKIRFVNALATSGAVDVLVNFAGQASGINQGAASSYASLPPRTDYVITFATPGGITVLASLTAQTLETGAVYTAYVFGTPSNAQARLVRDR